MKNDLLERFKKIYEEGTSYKVSWSKVDENDNLVVGIIDTSDKREFWLNVREYPTGEVYWF
ncbi:hypothetical protein [uncultured Clostridium sp.]|uniref:hypothetical protein n=1 Tax=uncultured Clostridium sp. TaxID=59620 RepID=UPI0025F72773|nr:hypothetical protein [uncultured Clostridium sp.]